MGGFPSYMSVNWCNWDKVTIKRLWKLAIVQTMHQFTNFKVMDIIYFQQIWLVVKQS